MDGVAHENRRVVDRGPLDALRKARLELGHLRPDTGRQCGLVRAMCLEDDDCNRRLVVEQGTKTVIARAQLQSRDVAQSGDFTIRPGLDDDVAELSLVGET